MELDQKDFIDSQLKANEGEIKESSMADLVDPNSTANKNPEAPRKKEEIKSKPTVDSEGYPIIERIRTYHGDIADAVKQDNLTMTQMAIAESKKNLKAGQVEEKKPASKASKSHLIIMIASAIIFLGGIGAVIFTFINNNPSVTPVTEQISPSVITSEEKVSFDITTAQRLEIQSEVASELSKAPKDPEVREIIPILKNSDGTSIKATPAQFLNAMNARIPDTLLRSLNPNYFLGINFAGQGEPFMIFFTSSYDIAYPALLDWEGYLKDDFAPYFSPRDASTAGYIFKDAVIYNHDARALEDNNGNTLFFYSIVNSNTLVFAKTADTLKEILDRLRTTKLQQ